MIYQLRYYGGPSDGRTVLAPDAPGVTMSGADGSVYVSDDSPGCPAEWLRGKLLVIGMHFSGYGRDTFKKFTDSHHAR